MIYFAYGLNLWISHMKNACPTAHFLGMAVLKDYRLAFRGNVTSVREDGAEIPGMAWELSPEEEEMLDSAIHFPDDYKKGFAKILLNGKEVDAMQYFVSNKKPFAPPDDFTLETLRWCYEKYGFDTAGIDRAIAGLKG